QESTNFGFEIIVASKPELVKSGSPASLKTALTDPRNHWFGGSSSATLSSTFLFERSITYSIIDFSNCSLEGKWYSNPPLLNSASFPTLSIVKRVNPSLATS